MKQSRSFKEYVAYRFEDKFYEAICEYVDENLSSLDLSSRKLHYVDRVD